MRQSNRNIMTAMMPEVRRPRVVTITTRAAAFACRWQPGYVCCIFVGAAQTACLAATVIPLRAIAGMRIANSVEAGE